MPNDTYSHISVFIWHKHITNTDISFSSFIEYLLNLSISEGKAKRFRDQTFQKIETLEEITWGREWEDIATYNFINTCILYILKPDT